MGIGISFTGRDGATRTMQAESPQEVRSALELAMGANSQTMGALGRRASRSQQHITNITNILERIRGGDVGGGEKKEGGEGKVEIDPNGSLTEGLQGLALKGDMPDGMARLQVYGETDGGKRGFWYLEDFDPASEAGATVGDSSSQSEDADNTERKRGAREPFSLPVVTRIAIVEDKNLPKFVHVYFFIRYVSFTGFGRACGISRETRIPLGMLNLNGGEGGGGTPIVNPTLPSVYDIITDNTGTGGAARTHFTNRYYEVSGVLREGPDADLESLAGKFVAIRHSGSSTNISGYANLGSMQSDMTNQSLVVIPLYKIKSDLSVEIDLRHVPRADMWSLALS